MHLGVSTRIGYTGFGAGYHSQPNEGATISAYHGTLSANATVVRWRRLQPVFGLTIQPLKVRGHIEGAADVPLRGLSVAATVGLKVLGVTPFATGGLFSSDNVRGNTPFITVGIAKNLWP